MTDLVLVIGGSGFLGKHVVRSLRLAGAEVVPVSRSGAEGRRLDVLDPHTFRSISDLRSSISHVVFAAGAVDPGNPHREFAAHTEGVERVLEWSRELDKLERIVLASSMLIYGDAEAPRATGLDFGQDHKTLYSFGKQKAEEVIANSDLPSRRVRLGLLLGDQTTGFVGANQPIARLSDIVFSLPIVPLRGGGAFPAWSVAVDRAAADIARATLDSGVDEISISADPDSPTLADLLKTLLIPYGRAPVILDPGTRVMRAWSLRRVLRRLGIDGDWVTYGEPWADLSRDEVRSHQTTERPHDPTAVMRTATYLCEVRLWCSR